MSRILAQPTETSTPRNKARADGQVAVDHEPQTAEHSPFGETGFGLQALPQPIGKILVVGHAPSIGGDADNVSSSTLSWPPVSRSNPVTYVKAFDFIRETKLPPLALLRAHGVAMALATDSNPGTAPLTSLLLTMNMAATLYRMTVDECIAGVTREAARALGLDATAGTLEVGKWADLAIWDIERPAELVYRMGFNPLFARVWRGQ